MVTIKIIYYNFRYWAITDPMTYPAKMTDKRAVILIFIVWVCSSAISFPAIAWWRATAPPMNETLYTSSKLPYLHCSSVPQYLLYRNVAN